MEHAHYSTLKQLSHHKKCHFDWIDVCPLDVVTLFWRGLFPWRGTSAWVCIRMSVFKFKSMHGPVVHLLPMVFLVCTDVFCGSSRGLKKKKKTEEDSRAGVCAWCALDISVSLFT